MTPNKHEIAAAGADWHAQSFCSHLRGEEHQRVWGVVYDLIYSSLEVYEGLLLVERVRYPVAFSNN